MMKQANTRDGRENKKDYWKTPWGVMLRHPDINNPTTKLGRLFRRRFRVPFPIFDEILVRRCREKNIFDIKSDKCVRIPLEFKILIALRILGRGNPADDIANPCSESPDFIGIQLSHNIIIKFNSMRVPTKLNII